MVETQPFNSVGLNTFNSTYVVPVTNPPPPVIVICLVNEPLVTSICDGLQPGRFVVLVDVAPVTRATLEPFWFRVGIMANSAVAFGLFAVHGPMFWI